jgi:glycosyltransferase involved in cell wall biosynthesis
MRILHVTSYYRPAREWGGPVRSVALLAQALARAGAEVEVVTTNARGSPGLAEVPPGTREVGGVPVTYCQASGPRRFFFSAELVAQVRRRARRADVVHLHGLWTWPVLATARVCEEDGVPYVLSPRGSLDPWALRQKSWKKRAYTFFVERHTLRHAALLHFTSADEQRSAPAEFRYQAYAVIPNCLDLDGLLALERGDSSLGDGEILVLGRIHPMKGFDLLIPALKRLADRGHFARLLVAGNDEGGYRRVVEELVAKHGLAGRVRFLGEVEDAEKEAAFRGAALLAAPSYRENFGNAVAEAMAAGLPVVVSERVGIAEDIAEAGAGVVVPLDPAALADAVGGLLLDPAARAAMGERGRRLVRERYTGPAVAAATLAAYTRARARTTSSETAFEDASPGP